MRVDFDTSVGGEGLPEEPAVLGEDFTVGVSEGFEQARGALDVGEHQGDGACGQLSHAPSACGGLIDGTGGRPRIQATALADRATVVCRDATLRGRAMRQELFTPMAGRATRSGAVEAERHGHLCMHQNLPERTRSVRCTPAQQQGCTRVAGQGLNGVTTSQLPCRFMALGVNRRHSMAVEFGL